MPKAPNTAVLQPNLGLYLGRPAHLVPPGGLQDCLNVRLKNQELNSFQMGWTHFDTETLNGPVTLLDQFFGTDGSTTLIAGTFLDLHAWDTATSKWLYLSPRYSTGTVSTTGASSVVTGVGTAWLANVKAGDFIYLHTVGNAAQRSITPAVGAWFQVASVTLDTSLTVIGTPPAITAQPYTIRQTFTAQNLNQYWRSATFPRGDIGGTILDRWYATNTVDSIVRLDLGGTQVVKVQIGASGFRCVDLVRYKNMLVYSNVTENSGAAANKPQSFKNSDVGKPETMTGGVAGEFVVGPGTAVILTAQTLGDELVVYTENEFVLSSFVGAPDIFAFRTAVDGVGAVGGRLIANYNDHHEVLGRDSLYTFNGVQVDTTDEHVWIKWIREQDQNRIRYGYVIFDEENAQVAWVMPRADDGGESPKLALEVAYAENVPDGTPSPYTKRDWPFTSAGFFTRTTQLTWNQLTNAWNTYFFSWGDRSLAGAFPLLLVGDFSGNVFILGTTDAQNGVGYASYARFGRRFVGDGRHRNVVRKVMPFMRQEAGATYNLTVTATAFDSEGQTVGTAVALPYNLAQADKDAILYVKPRVRGRLMDVQVGTAGSATGQGWRCNGYDFEIAPAGSRGA